MASSIGFSVVWLADSSTSSNGPICFISLSRGISRYKIVILKYVSHSAPVKYRNTMTGWSNPGVNHAQVTGSSSYPVWFANWTLDYAMSIGAMIVAPDYLLLPEVPGKEILEDMGDFWHWLHSPQFVEVIKYASDSRITPDLDRVLVVGESAGGYLAMQLALSYPSDIRAVIGAYLVLNLKSKLYTEAYSKPILGVTNFPNEIIEEHISASCTVVTAADPPNRLKLAFSVFQNGRLPEFLGSEDHLFPMNRVENLAATGTLKRPPTFIFHGKQDSAVPFEGSQRFVDLREQAPSAIINFHGQVGDHGFDFATTLETDWLKEGSEVISILAWLQNSALYLTCDDSTCFSRDSSI